MILKNLCSLIGVSGYEKIVTDYLYSLISSENLCDKIYKDEIENLICLQKGSDKIEKKKNIVICAHADEVGFQIIKKLDKERYAVKNLGSIKTWNAVGQLVKSNNAQGLIQALNYQNLQANNFNNLFLTSVNGGNNIKIGDVFTFDRPFINGEKYFFGKSLDNRASCYCLYKLIKAKIKTLADIFYVFTVQEETTMRGIRVIKTTLKPDLLINLDLSPENEMNSVKTGGGIAIKISDSLGFSSLKYVNLAEEIAVKNKIKFQFEVSDCGTSELIISNELDFGKSEIGFSLPCRNIHTSNSMIFKKDLTSAIKFLKKFLSIF